MKINKIGRFLSSSPITYGVGKSLVSHHTPPLSPSVFRFFGTKSVPNYDPRNFELKLFDEMQGVGLKPDFYTYCNMFDWLCRNGQGEQVVLLLDELEHKKGEIHLHINYYSIVMDGLCEAKKLDLARVSFRDIPFKGLEPDVVTYNIMIKGCCQAGQLEEAKELLLRMEQESLLPDEITYNRIVQGNLKRGQNEDAEKLFEQMCAKGFSPDAFTIELLLNLPGTTEQNPTILKMIQKLAPNTLKQK